MIRIGDLGLNPEVTQSGQDGISCRTIERMAMTCLIGARIRCAWSTRHQQHSHRRVGLLCVIGLPRLAHWMASSISFRSISFIEFAPSFLWPINRARTCHLAYHPHRSAPLESLPDFSAALAIPDRAALIFSAYCSGIRVDFQPPACVIAARSMSNAARS